jgi:DNA-3-methyladenine glycosylase II
MARLIAGVGACELPRRHGRYASLVRAILSQQVSTSAARTILGRLRLAAGGHLSAERIAGLDDARLRAVGLSRQKAGYVRDLSARVLSGDLRLDHVHKLDDEAVIAHLTQVKGIGRWTAEMFLMFVLNRPDVLPVDDLGIQNGFMRLYGLRKRPTAERMQALASPWRPYRTIGCWYLWRSLDGPAG